MGVVVVESGCGGWGGMRGGVSGCGGWGGVSGGGGCGGETDYCLE